MRRTMGKGISNMQEHQGFDTHTWVTTRYINCITDHKNSIYHAFKSIMYHVHMFLDLLYVRKNVTPHLGTSKKEVLNLYNQAMYEKKLLKKFNTISSNKIYLLMVI